MSINIMFATALPVNAPPLYPTDGPSELHAAALDYAHRGWRVMPCHPRQKNPVPKGWQKAATTDPDVIAGWWNDRPAYNVGVQLGPRSGIIDIECDSPEAEQALGALLGEDAPIVPTFIGKRGKHRLFRYSAALDTGKAVWEWRGIEFRIGGGEKGAQSIFPPSLHPSGVAYTWLVPPDDAELVPFPAEALARILPDAGRSHSPRHYPRRDPSPGAEDYRPARPAAIFLAVGALLSLDPRRAADYPSWLAVGMALHATDPGPILLASWIEWSRLCPEKYREGECVYKWGTFRQGGGYGLAHMFSWARTDSGRPHGRAKGVVS